MTLFDKITAIYSSLTHADFVPPLGTIDLQDDGAGAYIKSWAHPTFAHPTQAQIDAVTQPSSAQLLATYRANAKIALDATSVTVERIVEGVSAGTCAFANADVVTFMNYRKALRSAISATTAGTLPTRPPYPAGT